MNHYQDPLFLIGMKLGLERLYYLMDRNLNLEESIKAEKEVDVRNERLQVGVQVLMQNFFKANKLEANYKSKIYTIIDRFHHNTFVLINHRGIKLKRAINGAQLKILVKRDSARTNLFKA